MNQMALALGLEPLTNELGTYWCCGDCYPRTKGKYSLIWEPPDYTSGKCVHCKRVYTFKSREGKEELPSVS
jgi:hypothetical protein